MRLALLPRAALIAAAAMLVFAIGLIVTFALRPDLLPNSYQVLCRLDCNWYRLIALDGYVATPRLDSLQSSVAFFPAFPIVVRGLMLMTGLDFTAAALLLNAVYLMLFCMLVLASREQLLLRSDRDAAMFLLAFVLAPWSIYNRVPYTEMQFNLAMLATYVAWRREHYVAAALCGIALSATRVTGVFLPIALLIELLVRERWRIVELLRVPDARFRTLALMPLGGIAFYVYLGLHVGDPLANIRIQSIGWGHAIRNPVETLAGIVRSMSYDGLSAAFAFGVAAIGLSVGALRRNVPPPLALVGIAIISTSIISGPHGMARYALATFPVYLLVPTLPRVLQWPMIGSFALLQLAFTYFWAIRSPGLV